MRIFVFLLIMLPGWVMAQKKFKIHGKVKGLSSNSLISINDANNPIDTIAKAFSGEDEFHISGSIKEASLYYLNFTDAKKKILLFLSPDKIKIEGNLNDVLNLKITGSPSNDVFVSFQKAFNPIFEKLSKSRQDQEITFSNEEYIALQLKLDSFLMINKGSYVSPFVLVVTSQLNQDMALLEKRFNSLNKNAQQSFFGKYLKTMLDDSRVGAVGTEALDFTQNDTTGNPVSLSSFRGKYVLLDFWASWCGPCRQENPNVVSAYKKFRNKNFTVLGVSLDRAKDPWLKAIRDDGLQWTHLSDLKFWSNEVAMKYKVQSIPENYLIGPDGKIVAKNLRGEYLQIKLCELLGCN